MEDPTHCDICKQSITGSWVSYYDGKTGERTESRCSPCDDTKRREQFKKDHRISTRLLMAAMLNRHCDKDLKEGDREILDQNDLLEPEVKRFQETIWFGGMQDIARNAKVKGTSVEDGDFKILCYTMAGRAMVTLDSPTASLTLITAEDSKPGETGMGIQGIDATGPEARALLERAQKLWATGARTTEDREVRIAGF